MKNETTKIENLSPIAKELVKNGKTTVLFVSKSAFPNFYTYSENILNSFYQFYKLTEQGKDTEKAKNIAYADLKTMLSFIGKVNGFNITTNAQIENTTLFNDILSMCTKQNKICISAVRAFSNDFVLLKTQHLYSGFFGLGISCTGKNPLSTSLVITRIE